MTGTESRAVPRPAGDRARSGPARFRVPPAALCWLALACIGGSLLIMVGADLVRPDWMYPPLRLPASGFPFAATGLQVPRPVVVAGLWVSGVLGTAGVVAGLVAARRGARPPLRPVLIATAVVVAVLAVLPPAGSTDVLDYASYGRLLLLGHNPYLATPHLLRVSDPGFGLSVPWRWQYQVSLYGPAATFEQYLAARLGGDSSARVVFWLKLWNALGFGAVALVADRMLRADPARRLRAHLLWTCNPLLIWGLVAAGHLDVLGAAAGLLGLLALGPQPAARSPALARAALGGALVGVAADVKINYLAFGVGLAWALRRRPAGLLAAGAGGLLVLAPTYAWFGKPAVTALFARRNKSTVDSFYRLLDLSAYRPYLAEVALILLAALVLLLLWRLPAADPARPALRPALAVSVAWLVIWPYQLPWYDSMAICLLLLYPASALDWLVVTRLAVATLANMPGNPGRAPGHTLVVADRFIVHTMTPTALLTCAALLVLFALTGQWGVTGTAELGSIRGEPVRPGIAWRRLPARSRQEVKSSMSLEVTRLQLAELRGVDGLTWPVHGFLVTYPGGAVLVDTGVGGPQEWLDDWRVVNHSVADALDEHGLTPGDVGLVINTHLHFDHCGQNAVFKHAAFYVQRAELDRARRESPQLTDWFDFMNARFELLDGDTEILPGLSVLATPGHTTGHQSVLVRSADGRSDMLIGDAAYQPRQYLDPAADDLPDGQARDLVAWRESVRRVKASAPDRVHFCHHTDVLHS
jgi:glyoxylase-like metal-dependent hydrolase (beta-lactamase superfamily II)